MEYSKEEIENVVNKWGQTHEELCTNLGYDEETSDDLIMIDFIWDFETDLWITKEVNNEREQEIINYIKYK